MTTLFLGFLTAVLTPPAPGILTADDPLDARARAKARFKAEMTPRAALARQLRETIQGAYDARFREFYIHGRGSTILLLETGWAVVEAARNMESPPEVLGQVLEGRWRRARLLAEQASIRYYQGRTVYRELQALIGDEHRAALELLEHLQAFPPGPQNRMGGRWPADAPLVDPLEGRSQARARFAVSQATPAGLIRAQAEAYRNRGWPQYKEFLAGRGSGATMIHILETLMRLGQRLGYDTAHFRRQHWDLMAEVVAIYEVRYANGRLTIQDVQDVRQELLRTALDLRQVPAQVLPPRDEPPFLLSAEAWRPATDLAEEHQRAHQRQEAWEGDPVILRRRLRDLARDEWQASWQEFQKNRGSVSSLLDAARKELEAGLALVAEPIGRQQLREQYWRRTWEVEHLGERFYDLGRFSIQELLDVRYHRLRAEWELK